MRAAIGTGLAFALFLGLAVDRASAQQEKAKGNTLHDKILGTYTLTYGRSAGKEIPKERLNGRATITRDTITTYDNDNNEVYVIKYNLAGDGGLDDATGKISMVVTRSSRKEAVDTKALGLVKVAGDKLELIYDYGSQQYPSTFKTETEKQNLFILERRDEQRNR